MSDQIAPAAATPTQAAPPASPSIDQASALSQLLGFGDEPAKPAPKPEPAAEAKLEPKPGESRSVVPKVKEPIDPLDEADFDEVKLNSPEAIKAARERLLKARAQQAELTRASHRAHGAAGRREAAVERREAEVEKEKAAVVAYDRAFKASIADMQSGDPDKFLTAIHRLGNVGDPAGFWRTISLKLASGGTFSEAEKKAAQADPEIQRRLEQIEQAVKGKQEADEIAEMDQRLAAVKARNLDIARNEAAAPAVSEFARNPNTSEAAKEVLALTMDLAFRQTKQPIGVGDACAVLERTFAENPRVAAYATDPRTANYTVQSIEEIVTKYRQDGRPIDIRRACEILEENLAVHLELSQRANGTAQARTDRENETAGSVPEAGRAPSQEPPKPATTQATIPATLSTSPGGAQRRMSEEEMKREQIRQLEAAGFF